MRHSRKPLFSGDRRRAPSAGGPPPPRPAQAGVLCVHSARPRRRRGPAAATEARRAFLVLHGSRVPQPHTASESGSPASQVAADSEPENAACDSKPTSACPWLRACRCVGPTATRTPRCRSPSLAARCRGRCPGRPGARSRRRCPDTYNTSGACSGTPRAFRGNAAGGARPPPSRAGSRRIGERDSGAGAGPDARARPRERRQPATRPQTPHQSHRHAPPQTKHTRARLVGCGRFRRRRGGGGAHNAAAAEGAAALRRRRDSTEKSPSLPPVVPAARALRCPC